MTWLYQVSNTLLIHSEITYSLNNKVIWGQRRAGFIVSANSLCGFQSLFQIISVESAPNVQLQFKISFAPSFDLYSISNGMTGQVLIIKIERLAKKHNNILFCLLI